MQDDLKAIKDALAAATRGEWKFVACSTENCWCGTVATDAPDMPLDERDDDGRYYVLTYGSCARHDAAYIAACSPDRIARLVARLEEETQRANSAELMAECTTMLRADLIRAGLMTEAVAPMFMTEAIFSVVAAERRAAADALARLEAAEKSQWRPIETAPKDDTRVLAYFPRHPFDEDENMNEAVDLGGVMAVTWRNGGGWIEPDYMDAIGAWFGDDCCYAPAPTHWMPLPAPPAAIDATMSAAQREGADRA